MVGGNLVVIGCSSQHFWNCYIFPVVTVMKPFETFRFKNDDNSTIFGR